MQLTRTIFFAFVLSILSCDKKEEADPCDGKKQPVASFAVKEIVGDTSFTADTIFRDNYVQFEALDSYDSVSWKIGHDPRVFTKPRFALSFINDLITVEIGFTGYKRPNLMCFPNDDGVYNGVKPLTVLEQFDRTTLTKSPLIGRYRGSFTDRPTDTFIVRIDYFDSTKYNTSTTGAKNFYWISNIPKGYIDSTSDPALAYPELRNGFSMEMGYKSFVFSGGFNIRGKGWLQKDSLFVNYIGYNLAAQKKFVGKKL
ncbi:MAG: hypothetical protein JWQ96_1090 [Segetibacter sp.]|nr:hypothetical protein [Segetibacter sp.]